MEYTFKRDIKFVYNGEDYFYEEGQEESLNNVLACDIEARSPGILSPTPEPEFPENESDAENRGSSDESEESSKPSKAAAKKK